ncbi:hypothetical protein VPH35_009610 [Triticum aestivum]
MGQPCTRASLAATACACMCPCERLGRSIVGCQGCSWIGWAFFYCPRLHPPVKISPLLPSLLCSLLPRSPPSLPSRRRLHAAADAAFSPRRSRCRSPASLAACRGSGSGADLCAPTSPPPLPLSPMPPSLQGAGDIGAKDRKQRVGRGGLELLGRWRRPSWFVMEAAPPASWLRYVSDLLVLHGCSSFSSQTMCFSFPPSMCRGIHRCYLYYWLASFKREILICWSFTSLAMCDDFFFVNG